MPNWFERGKTKSTSDNAGTEDDKKKKTGSMSRLSFRKKIKDIVNDLETTQDKPGKVSGTRPAFRTPGKFPTIPPAQAKPTSIFEAVQLKRTQVNQTKKNDQPKFVKPQLKPVRKDEKPAPGDKKVGVGKDNLKQVSGPLAPPAPESSKSKAKDDLKSVKDDPPGSSKVQSDIPKPQSKDPQNNKEEDNKKNTDILGKAKGDTNSSVNKLKHEVPVMDLKEKVTEQHKVEPKSSSERKEANTTSGSALFPASSNKTIKSVEEAAQIADKSNKNVSDVADIKKGIDVKKDSNKQYVFNISLDETGIKGKITKDIESATDKDNKKSVKPEADKEIKETSTYQKQDDTKSMNDEDEDETEDEDDEEYDSDDSYWDESTDNEDWVIDPHIHTKITFAETDEVFEFSEPGSSDEDDEYELNQGRTIRLTPDKKQEKVDEKTLGKEEEEEEEEDIHIPSEKLRKVEMLMIDKMMRNYANRSAKPASKPQLKPGRKEEKSVPSDTKRDLGKDNLRQGAKPLSGSAEPVPESSKALPESSKALPESRKAKDEPTFSSKQETVVDKKPFDCSDYDSHDEKPKRVRTSSKTDEPEKCETPKSSIDNKDDKLVDKVDSLKKPFDCSAHENEPDIPDLVKSAIVAVSTDKKPFDCGAHDEKPTRVRKSSKSNEPESPTNVSPCSPNDDNMEKPFDCSVQEKAGTSGRVLVRANKHHTPDETKVAKASEPAVERTQQNIVIPANYVPVNLTKDVKVEEKVKVSVDDIKPRRTSTPGDKQSNDETKISESVEKESGKLDDLQEQNDKLLDTDKPPVALVDTDKPPVALNGNIQKDDKTEEQEDKDTKQIERLEKLIKAKENSIKTFITKNDCLTNELLSIKEYLRDKDNALRSVNESLQVVVDRCSYKTKQYEDMEEECEKMTDHNRLVENELEVLKRKFGDLESECQDYMRLNDDNKDVMTNQKQLLRRREEEILELRRECEERVDREKSSVENIKKRAERSSTEAEETQTQLKRLREKMEKEKQGLFEEIQRSERVKADISAKLLTTETHVKKGKEEHMNTANLLSFAESELHALQLKFNGITKDKNGLKDDITNMELKVNSAVTENKSLKKELESVKIDKDTLSQQKVSLGGRVTTLQRELENEKEKSSKNTQAIEDYKRQCQQYQNDVNLANSRSDEVVKSTIEEEQEARRKWQQRLHEAEDEITRLTARLKVSEKSRAEQGAEIEQVGYDLTQLKKSYSTLEKKHHQDEQLLTEQQMLEQESKEKIETMKRRMTDYSSQISTLKQEQEDEISQNRELRLKLKSVQDELDDAQHDKENNERRQQEMSRQIGRLQEQLESQTGTITELEGDLEGATSRADKAHKELLLAMESQTTTISEKDEEIDLVKKTCRGTINLLKTQLDEAEQEINKHNLMKGEMEQEILLLQGDLDEAEATINELNNEIPRQQDILEQLNMSLSEMSARCEALQDALVRADLKCTQLGTRNEELETDLNKEESSKRQMVQDNIDLNNKVAESSSKIESLLETVGKMEDQLHGQSRALETLDDEKTEWTLEKRKMREIITALEADNQHLEESRDSLVGAEKKLKTRIQAMLSEHEDTLTAVRQTQRARLRALESRVAELENILEDETEERANHEKAVKKLERILNEMELQAREDTKTIERQVEQINALSVRNKNLKVSCADTESRVTTLQSRLRKITAEMEESENRATTMSKMLSTPASSRCGTPASLRQSRMMSRMSGCCNRTDSRMSWDEYVDPKVGVVSGNVYTAMLRNSSLAGSRPSSRLISPEVEQIILSGRNSPIGPLAPLSPGYMSPLARSDGEHGHFLFEDKINGNCGDSELTKSEENGVELAMDGGQDMSILGSQATLTGHENSTPVPGNVNSADQDLITSGNEKIAAENGKIAADGDKLAEEAMMAGENIETKGV